MYVVRCTFLNNSFGGYNPETSSRVTLASLGTALQADLLSCDFVD